MCDEGRLSYRRLFTDRLTEIRLRDRVFEYWPASMRVIPEVLEGDGDRRWAMVLSPQSSAEGLLAAVHFGKDVLGAQIYVRGGRPEGSADDILIRADKNPNNAALNRVTQLISLAALGDLLAAIEEGKVNALWMMGVHLPVDARLYDQFVGALEGLDLVVLQSSWAGRLADVADIVLPAATHAEHEGTFINCDGVVQTAEQAYPPMGSARADWEIFQLVAGRLGHSLPFETRAQALEVIGVVPMEQPELGEGGYLRAPHGPQRPIPQRSATPPREADRYAPQGATSQQR
jgi:anaerobic selenocysteine-containing dehydrogenase